MGVRKMKRLWLILAMAFGLAAMAVPASADVVYTLNTDSDFSTGNNFGTVTLHQDVGNTTTVVVTVQLNTSIQGIGFAKTGAGFAIAWDLKGGAPDTIAVDTTNTPHANKFAVQKTGGNYLGDYKAAPFTSGNTVSGFQYAIDYTGDTGANNKLVFDVTRSSGLSIDDFNIGNPTWKFAVDLITKAGSTRNVAVPEAHTWTISLAGLLGLGALVMLQRRRKTNQAA